MEKLRFRDLSFPLKLVVVASIIDLSYYIIGFIYGLIFGMGGYYG